MGAANGGQEGARMPSGNDDLLDLNCKLYSKDFTDNLCTVYMPRGDL